MTKYAEIDLDDTDGDSDGEECGTDEYDEEDGFINDAVDSKAEAPTMVTQSMDEMSDVMWADMLRKQASAWAASGKGKRSRHELEYKLGQFRTPHGFREAAAIAEHYGLCFTKPRMMTLVGKYTSA